MAALHLYNQDAAPTFGPTLKGTWNDTTNAANQGGLFTSPSGASATLGIATATATDPWDVLLAGWNGAISAQTVLGRVKWIFGTSRSGTTSPMTTKIHIWVSVGSTSVVRGTLLDNYVAPSAWSTTAQGIADGWVSMTPVVASLNDCIVIEVGYRKTGTNATSQTGTIYYGSSAASPDLGSADTNVTSRPGWIEFSNIPIFAPTLPMLGV